MNKDSMISKIYEVILPDDIYLYPWCREYLKNKIMIWDVLDWISKNNLTFTLMRVWWKMINKNNNWELLFLRDNKRESLENQSDECIEYIYNLVNPSK